jgi:hypothetical protein
MVTLRTPWSVKKKTVIREQILCGSTYMRFPRVHKFIATERWVPGLGRGTGSQYSVGTEGKVLRLGGMMGSQPGALILLTCCVKIVNMKPGTSGSHLQS